MPVCSQSDMISQYSLASYAADAAKAIVLAANVGGCDNDTVIDANDVMENLINSDFHGITVSVELKCHFLSLHVYM